MKELLLATSNPGKIQEIKAILAGIPLRLLTPAELGLRISVSEDSGSYVGNAYVKGVSLRACCRATNPGGRLRPGG